MLLFTDHLPPMRLSLSVDYSYLRLSRRVKGRDQIHQRGAELKFIDPITLFKRWNVLSFTWSLQAVVARKTVSMWEMLGRRQKHKSHDCDRFRSCRVIICRKIKSVQFCTNFPFEEKLLLTSFSRNMINNIILFSPMLHKMQSCSLVFFIMWTLRERYIVSFRKHHWNVTFECSLNVPKQAVTFQNIRGTSN